MALLRKLPVQIFHFGSIIGIDADIILFTRIFFIVAHGKIFQFGHKNNANISLQPQKLHLCIAGKCTYLSNPYKQL